MFTISMTSEGKVEVVSVHDTSSGPRPCLLRVERDKAVRYYVHHNTIVKSEVDIQKNQIYSKN